MLTALLPFNEELRLQDLYALDILDSPPEKDFDDLIELAAQLYGCPIAALTLIDRERQWFKAKKGIAGDSTARDISFCAHTILEEDALIVGDARRDKRFSENPDVSGGLDIRFYAGVPIVSTAGYRLGVVCVVDREPRELHTSQAKSLKIISQQVTKLLELRLKNKLTELNAKKMLDLEKELVQMTRRDQERERLLIGRELHENIAQQLSAIKFFLEMAEGKMDVAYVQKSRKNISALIDQLRTFSNSIVPSTMKQYDLKDVLGQLLEGFEKNKGLIHQLECIGTENIPRDLVLVLYRLVEDCLNYITRHADTDSVLLKIIVRKEITLELHVGCSGLDITQFKKGFAWKKSASAISYYGGHLNITADGDYRLSLRLPLKQATAEIPA